jgi:N-methylhydantoinase A/oxoprolinase/acetone carboxylase beta subunit
LPALDIHTIGAGGGSIARLDAGGALVVGPESAGAVPGPACYGSGGESPTVTDADLVLARIPAEAAFPGLGRLDVAAARRALDRERITADGVVAVVDAAMERAVRVVTVERGVDARDLALVAFGGAGPLHACAVAGALGMRAVIVPPRAGVLSAVGLVCSARQRELVRSWPRPLDHAGVDAALESVADEAVALVGGGDVEVERLLDCRYAGQSHELTVSSVDAFPAEHERRNGFARPGAPVEVVALRVRARRPAPLSPSDLPPVARPEVRGPEVVAEPDCTVWVPDGWRAEPGPLGAWVLTR